MKKTGFYLAFAAMIFSFGYSAFAQQGRGPRDIDPKEFAERQTSQMKESLKLTAEQLPKVEALNLQYAHKMKDAREEAGDDRESMRETMMEMIREKDVELKKILTAEQWTILEKQRQERMQNRQGGRRGI
jgi:Spy/CpxP family protein refolding chaperone